MADESTIESTFFSGWRPAIGWISVVSLSLQFIVNPVLKMFLAVLKSPVVIPDLDTGPLMGLVVTILGMGGLRTIEKFNGTQGTH